MTIREMRLSFIQMETLVPPLAALVAPIIPYGFLLSDAKYTEQYAPALAGTGIHWPPWRDDMGKMYWFDYFGRADASKLTKEKVWQNLAPLQTPCAIPAPAQSTPGSVVARAYLYPWGIAGIADVAVQGSWTLKEAVDLAFRLRRQLPYQVTVNGATKELPLPAMLNTVIADVRTTAYGPGIPSVRGEAFSIVTVLDGEGVDVAGTIDKGLQQALDALTNWNPDWNAIDPGDLKASLIRIRKAPASHALYAGQRGRAVWFPAGFKSVSNSDRLKCYHNNLMMATLQTDSLCRLAAAAAGQLASGQQKKDWSQAYQNCVRIAGGLLGRIYGGQNTYRTRSVKELIKTKPYLDSVNAARQLFGMEQLRVKTAQPAATPPAPTPPAAASNP
jgi:hypothetical protein